MTHSSSDVASAASSSQSTGVELPFSTPGLQLRKRKRLVADGNNSATSQLSWLHESLARHDARLTIRIYDYLEDRTRSDEWGDAIDLLSDRITVHTASSPEMQVGLCCGYIAARIVNERLALARQNRLSGTLCGAMFAEDSGTSAYRNTIRRDSDTIGLMQTRAFGELRTDLVLKTTELEKVVMTNPEAGHSAVGICDSGMILDSPETAQYQECAIEGFIASITLLAHRLKYQWLPRAQNGTTHLDFAHIVNTMDVGGAHWFTVFCSIE